jgi:metallo-beta-lactamase class B
MVYTPRSYNKDGTPGEGFSYFIPVKIQGKRHLWATFGQSGFGTIPLWQNSMAHFLTYVDKLKPDIAISSHPFVDGSIRRMELIRECNDKQGPHIGWNDGRGYHKGWNDQECRNNPFLIGKDAARRYFEIMDQCAVVQQMRSASGLNGSGFLACPVGKVLDPLTNTCK